MSYHIIDNNESYSRAHDDFLKYYFAEKTNFTVKAKMAFLNKALSINPRFILDARSSSVILDQEDVQGSTKTGTLNYLAPTASYNIYYKKDLNEFSLNHSDEGKLDYFLNTKLYKHKNILSSIYFKNEIVKDEIKSVARFKFHLDSNKLLILGLNREGKTSEFGFKDYFKNVTLAGFYGFSPAQDLFCIAGAKTDFSTEERNLLSSAVTLSAVYKDFKKTLNFGRFESEKVLFANCSLDWKYNGIKLAADIDYSNKDSESKLKGKVKDSGFKVAVEFPLENETWSKIMLNHKKDFFVTFGKNYGSNLFTFGGKISAAEGSSRLKYDVGLSFNFA